MSPVRGPQGLGQGDNDVSFSSTAASNGMSSETTGRGTFIVVEGTDGSGKGTQVAKLIERLASEGYDVASFDFPQYDEPSSHFVKQYLNGKYGTAEEVGPYTGSLFYALDRYEAAPKIRQAIADGKIVIANRFTGSNMAHQGTKFFNPEQRRGYFIWLDNLEFEMLKIPRPDRSIVLRVPAAIAQTLVDQKEARSYTDKKRDMHEADLNHLERSVEVFDDLCQLFPKDFARVDCVRDDKLLDIDTVHSLLWQAVEPLLPPKPKNKKGSVMSIEQAPSLENPFVIKHDGQIDITPEGYELLADAVTDTTGNVYALTGKGGITPLIGAAAMARLSRNPHDMRKVILDEFAGQAGKEEGLLHRVITAFGDDSVQQLIGQHVVVEKSSNLMTKKLEWGRMASYLEQSTRYIFFDQKDYSDKDDKTGKYKYFTPDQLDPVTTEVYDETMEEIFDTYSHMVRKLVDHITSTSNTPEEERDGAWRMAVRAQACDAIRPVLPVATTSTVGIFGSGQALESLIMHLRASDSKEERDTGDKLLNELRKVIPIFLERADKPERGGATTAYMANTRHAVKELADKYLPNTLSPETEAVSLDNYWPRNEIDLVAHMVYEHSDLPLDTIQEEVAGWTMDRKLEVFQAYMGERLNRRHRPGRALEQAHYSWDLVCDYGIFRDLQRHRMVDDLNWQALTPRYGYDIPKLVEDAELSEEFEKCFDLSLELYSHLQQAGYPYEAQYATLLGHKMRWKVTYNAREAFHLHELRTTPQGHPGYRKLVGEMHEKLTEVHPLLGEAMKFVNKDEDAELTRLAAERATQYKLEQLDKKT